jgi:Raf kinase inhibitor-like YbhB/YbcL family protein
MPEAPSFRVTSPDVLDGKTMPRRMANEGAGGANISPPLTWYGFPDGVRSFVVTMFDADARTPSGFWHWVVMDVPASVEGLAEDAGSSDATLPPGARHLRNDGGNRRYDGPAPPPGHGPHRYFIAVHAVDVERLPVDDDVSVAYLHLTLLGHTLARAVMMPTYETPALGQEEEAA